jgi:hypothetical protein
VGAFLLLLFLAACNERDRVTLPGEQPNGQCSTAAVYTFAQPCQIVPFCGDRGDFHTPATLHLLTTDAGITYAIQNPEILADLNLQHSQRVRVTYEVLNVQRCGTPTPVPVDQLPVLANNGILPGGCVCLDDTFRRVRVSCIRIESQPAPNCRELTFTRPNDDLSQGITPLGLNIRNNCLELHVAYSGCGRMDTSFSLVYNGNVFESHPPQMQLALRGYNPGPGEIICQAYWEDTLRFDLSALRALRPNGPIVLKVGQKSIIYN